MKRSPRVKTSKIDSTTMAWVGLVGLVALSRWLAFPASIWDQDEAYFALGVLRFDPLNNQPHPPFFPLWISAGKLVHWLPGGLSPEASLQFVSVLFSVWILWPMRRFWSLVLPPSQAAGAAVLFAMLPAPWLLAGRAYTETTASALFIAGAVLWLPRDPSRRDLVVGGLLGAASVLVRPQWLVVVLPIFIWRLVTSSSRRVWVLIPPLVPLGIGAIALAAASGGFSPLVRALEQHSKLQVMGLQDQTWRFAEFTLHKSLGGIIPGTLWIVLSLVGAVVLLKRAPSPSMVRRLIWLVMVPMFGLALLAQNPTLARYAIPLLALTVGLVVAAIAAAVGNGSGTQVAVAAAVVVSILAVAPMLGDYRTTPSPAVAAMDHVIEELPGRLLVCDRTLSSFLVLEGAKGLPRTRVVWDFEVELGRVRSQYRANLTAVFAADRAEWVADPGKTTRYCWDHALFRGILSPRFLDVTVVDGCALVQPAEPSITPDMLTPGAVIQSPPS